MAKMDSMSNVINMLVQSISPLALVRSRAKVLAREDRLMRSELVRIRRQNKLTQKDVADLLGVSHQAVQKLERYDADPKLSTLRRYANAVGAIVEHSVTVDVGQSAAMAAPSQWESKASPESEAVFWRVSTRARAPRMAAQQSSAWSEFRRSQFELRA